MEKIFDENGNKLVLTTLDDYLTLKLRADTKHRMITTPHLMFLASLVNRLHVQGFIIFGDDYIGVKFYKSIDDDECEISGNFSIDLIEKYLGQVDRFISDVL